MRSLRAWLLVATGAAALFLSGLVLSHFVWNRLEQAPAMPCADDSDRWKQAAANIERAAALLSRQAPELELTPAHLFPFDFDYLCVVRHGLDDEALDAQLGVHWDCADEWQRQVLDNDTFLSLIAVSGDTVIPVRLSRTRFDVAGQAPARIAPTARLLLRIRPGSDQVLLHFP